MKKNTYSVLAAVCFLIAVFFSCTKETLIEKSNYPGLPVNPYDTIEYGHPLTDTISIDSSSIVGLHTYIFSTRCAAPGCHDGNFEPDFRTVQSTYYTLVYHDVIKNNVAKTFKYRVVPGDTAMSWLHERITTDDAVLGRMPLYDSLAPDKIKLIEKWILGGAKDIFGNSAMLPNYQPTTFGIYAVMPDSGNKRVDTLRNGNIINPFVVDKGVNLTIWFGLYDTDAAGSFIPATNLTYNKVKFATRPTFFGSVPEQTLTKDLLPTMLPVYDGSTQGPYFHHVTINTAQFASGSIVYMRAYVQDANHSIPTEIPSTGSPFYLQTYFSFVVK